jgi:hypothetical protein
MSAEYTNLATALGDAQNAGMVLDVSRLKADGLGGVPVPAGTANGVPGYPVVSNSYAGYKLAMDLLSQSGTDFSAMADTYLQQFGAGRQSPSPRATIRPPSPRVPSPQVTVRPPSPRVPSPRAPSPRVPSPRAPSPRVTVAVRPPSPRVPSPRVAVVAQQTVAVPAAKSPKQTKVTLTPQQRLAAAYNKSQADGKLLDVSKLANDGTGYKSAKPPKTARGTKKGINPVPVISDNYQAYALAMAMLGEGFKPYADQYYQTYGGGQILPQTQQKKAAGPSTRYGDLIASVPVPLEFVDVATVNVRPLGTQSPRARSPRAKTPKSPRAKTPKAAKSPRAKKAAKAKKELPNTILIVPETAGQPASPGRVTVVRPPSPRNPSPGRLTQPPRAVLIPQ